MKKGFTLIELLAVIVILAIIALIATPLVLGIIDETRKSAYKESLRSIFEATDLYIATNEFRRFPDEGILVIDANIKLKNKNFTTGKIIKNNQGQLELERVGNGIYCGSGTIDNIIVIKGSCVQLDITPPTLVNSSGTVTSNSITIVASADDPESGVSGYQFSNDNGVTWTSTQTSNVYTFTGLVNNTAYTFKTRVINNNNLISESLPLVVSTNNMPAPTYSINTADWTGSAEVTITYPTREEGYVYEYSLDNGNTWTEVVSPAINKVITFNENGSVIARISDGINVINGTTFNVTNIDATAPIIIVDSSEVTTFLGITYTDAGVTASDPEMGDITSDIVVTGTVDTSIAGTYKLTYNVSDAAGNAATPVTRIVIVEQGVFTFSDTGSVQTFTVPATGAYKLEVWGAQGGNSYNGPAGGKGGYSSGEINLDANESIYIYVGRRGSNGNGVVGGGGGYNGGGNSANAGEVGGGGGGGATDIRRNGTALANRIIVAGGGGGGSAGNGFGYDSYGGAGGGLEGLDGTGSHSPGHGGTQTSGGAGASYAMDGSLGKGGNARYCSNCTFTGGGGGGGYYGGGSGGYNGGGGGGGGSGYIGGVINGQTINGNSSMPSPSGGTMTGRSVHGYAKITFIP